MTTQKEFGDFQTPIELAEQVVKLVDRTFGIPTRVVEPTCGLGSFLEAAFQEWGVSISYEGYEVNDEYVSRAAKLLPAHVKLTQQDFFTTEWHATLNHKEGERLLVLGNPPWVTNSALGLLGSKNLPSKSNFQGLRGFDARTGKSNFDIAEWILIKLIESMSPASALAMLCKTMTARKVLNHFWKTQGGFSSAKIYLIDAKEHFDVAVDACLLYCSGAKSAEKTASVYSTLVASRAERRIGLVDGQLVSNVTSYKKFRDVDGGSPYVWRSGVKHDASKVMEFTRVNGHFVNAFDEEVELEQDYVYPLLKSSDVANGRVAPRRYVLVTQRTTKQSTDEIREKAPATWSYLLKHAALLDERRSSIYQMRPRFSVFGIGEYAFSPWKVAISGLYKNYLFVAIPPVAGRPVMVDDTCYFIPCHSQREATFVTDLLNSEPCQQFLTSIVFRDSKRPITIDVLRRISLVGVARVLGRMDELKDIVEPISLKNDDGGEQMNLVMDRQSRYSKRKSI